MKDRVLDSLKLIGICIAVIAFFTFLAASCEDKEDRAEREAAEEELHEQIRAEEDLHEQIRAEAYHEGFGDGVSEAYAGNAFIVDDHYLKIYDEGYSDGYSDASERSLEDVLFEANLDDIIDYLNGLYSIEFDESLARYGFYREHN